MEGDLGWSNGKLRFEFDDRGADVDITPPPPDQVAGAPGGQDKKQV